MSRLVVLLTLAACTSPDLDAREQRVIDALAEDNYMWAHREPALVDMKLKKMQRGPYEWLRGTALLYWRDAMDAGAERAATAFGSPAASRVLLLGDPHVENVGTFRASDGTMFVDWNDFDATGYGPYTVDLRRLAASFAVVCEIGAPGDTELAQAVVDDLAWEYAATIADLDAGVRIGTVGFGAHELLDDELAKATKRGQALYAVDEIAPATDGVRALALGDLEDVGEDGVIEDRLLALTAQERSWIDAAIALWKPGARVRLAARRIGSGVASYSAYRFNVILDDDRILELKETRDGLLIPRLPQWAAAEWSHPAERAINTQTRLHARPDGDGLLGAALVGGLSLKIRDREAFQRGVDASDVAEYAKDGERDLLLALARFYGGLVARAHGVAHTSDGVPGHTVIAPLLAGRADMFAAEIRRHALADAQQILTDFAAMKDRDLSVFVLPGDR